ncbi:MAG: phosphoglycerate dehydrogenase [Candidatus Dadabacteria bacterium]|nr:MAG: phosphoglycerate dehydrogenase [Candidatus Dadabacteria bacterium]
MFFFCNLRRNLLKILITDGLSKEGLELFAKHKDLELDLRKKTDPQELKEIINNYQAVIIRSATKIDAEVVSLLGEDFKLIGRAGIGVDNVDIKAASKKGIIVMNTPSANAITTAEHTIALLFSLARNTPQAFSSMKELKWERSKFQGTELFGKTMGIVGMGNIGRLVAERALGLRMKVIAHDPYISKDTNLNMPIELVDMDEIFKLSDVITVHTPLTSTTKNLISKGSIDMMKEGVRIINCARGGIVNEEDVAEAITNGKIGGLAIDVFESEPPDFKSPIFKLSDKVVFTPHLGASTQEAQTKVGIAMAEQVIEFANKGVVSNAVNMPSMSTEVLSEISPYLELAEKLGSFMGQTCKVGVKEIIVEYGGNVAEMNVAPLTVTALKGYLSPVMSAPVTYVNAPLIAEERGIKLTETKVSTEGDFSSLVSVIVKTDEGKFSISGSIFGTKEPRFTRLNKHGIDLAPQGNILMIENYDRPGVVGLLGAALGKKNINIGRLFLTRHENSANEEFALAFISVDSPVSEETLEDIANLPEVKTIDQVIFS